MTQKLRIVFILFALFAPGSSFQVPTLERSRHNSSSLVTKERLQSPRTRIELSPKDYTDAAAGFFGGLRIPASLIAGASFGRLFALSQRPINSNGERLLVVLHNVNMLVAFLLCLSTVIISTAANVSILHRGFDPVASSGYVLLKREFGLQFLSCRLSFLSGCLSFLFGVFHRSLLEFQLLKPEKGMDFILLSFSWVALSWLWLVTLIRHCIVILVWLACLCSYAEIWPRESSRRRHLS